MFNAGILEKVVKEITGHCSNAVQEYEHTSLSLKHKATDTIKAKPSSTVISAKEMPEKKKQAKAENEPIKLGDSDLEEIPCSQVVKLPHNTHEMTLQTWLSIEQILGNFSDKKVKKIRVNVEVDLDSNWMQLVIFDLKLFATKIYMFNFILFTSIFWFACF